MKLIPAIKFFTRDSRTIGILLLCCTAISLLVSNSDFGEAYTAFWQAQFLSGTGRLQLNCTPLHFVNDALMSGVFFLAGLEIKKEILRGELNSFKKSLMPVLSATGGMIFPAVIYLAWCHTLANFGGWGIPIATDIAFSLGVLSLLGSRATSSMRIFLTAVAIFDDIGGILTIAIFYAGHPHWLYFFLATGVVLALLALNFFKVTRLYPYLLLGVFLWYFTYCSGIHPTIAGVILAFAMPSACIPQLENVLRVPVNFVVLPLFALANTAIMIPHTAGQTVFSPVFFGVFTEAGGRQAHRPFCCDVCGSQAEDCRYTGGHHYEARVWH